MTLLVLVPVGLVSLPILGVLARLLNDSDGVWHHLADTLLATYVVNSTLLVAGVGAVATALGVTTALLTTRTRFAGRALFEWALLLPLACPAYIIAYVYTDLLEFSGPVQTALRALTGWGPGDYWFPEIRSLGGAIAVLGCVLYPYVYLLTAAALRLQDHRLVDAARVAGAGPLRRVWSITLPLARPGVIAGLTLAAMETLADFGTVDYFGVPTLTAGIYRTWFGFGALDAAAQLSACLLGGVALLLLVERWARRRRLFHGLIDPPHRPPGPTLGPGASALAILACVLPILVGFVVPAAVLAWYAATTPSTAVSFLPLSGNSLKLAGVTAGLAVTLALALAYAVWLCPTPLRRSARGLAGLGYAIPGTVLGVSIVGTTTAVDRVVADWTGGGLLITGSLVGLVFACLVRTFAVALHTVDAGFAKIPDGLGRAARVVGAGPLTTLGHIHMPLLRGGLLAATILVFVDVMKELPATLILRPFNFDTLAIRVYQLASDERLADASGAALAIVLVGLVPVAVLARAGK